MIIIEEKMPPQRPHPALVPPPPYSPGAMSSWREKKKLGDLPPHLLLKVVYATFTDLTSIEKQRKTLYWLTISLRLVNRAFYIGTHHPQRYMTAYTNSGCAACMHILRSTYIPAYNALVRPPYSSDPFPLTSASGSTQTSKSPISWTQRETQVLDLFIALKVREDVWLDDTELYLERDEGFRDLFDLMQPRARMEDLVRTYGVREGVVSVDSPDTIRASSSSSARARATALPFSVLSVSFSSRRVGLVLTTRERKKTIVEVQRAKDERLETAAKSLVKELRNWLKSNSWS